MNKLHRMERQIAEAAIQGLIGAGYQVEVFDGEETVTPATDDMQAILAGMFGTDEDYLFAYQNGKRVGFVYLVYGNCGWDVISDYSVGLEPALGGANALADRLDEQNH